MYYSIILYNTIYIIMLFNSILFIVHFNFKRFSNISNIFLYLIKIFSLKLKLHFYIPNLFYSVSFAPIILATLLLYFYSSTVAQFLDNFLRDCLACGMGSGLGFRLGVAFEGLRRSPTTLAAATAAVFVTDI